MNTGLRIRVALHTDRLAGPLAGAGVSLRALTAHGQTAQMTDAAVTFDTLQTFEVHAQFAAQITLDDIFPLLDRVNDLGELLLGQILRPDRRVNVGAFENFLRVDRADAVDLAQRNVNALVRRNFNPNDACHK